MKVWKWKLALSTQNRSTNDILVAFAKASFSTSETRPRKWKSKQKRKRKKILVFFFVFKLSNKTYVRKFWKQCFHSSRKNHQNRRCQWIWIKSRKLVKTHYCRLWATKTPWIFERQFMVFFKAIFVSHSTLDCYYLIYLWNPANPIWF